MNKLLQKFFAAIKKYDDTYNFTCDVCGREVFGNERVCTACMKTLPWNNGAMCPFCGRKTEEPGARSSFPRRVRRSRTRARQ